MRLRQAKIKKHECVQYAKPLPSCLSTVLVRWLITRSTPRRIALIPGHNKHLCVFRFTDVCPFLPVYASTRTCDRHRLLCMHGNFSIFISRLSLWKGRAGLFRPVTIVACHCSLRFLLQSFLIICSQRQVFGASPASSLYLFTFK